MQTTISCVVWNSLLDKLAQVPIPGEQLIVLGSIRLYPQRGQYQLTVWQTLPAGEGLLAALPAVAKPVGVGGLFDLERKRSLPTHPSCCCRHISLCRAWVIFKRHLVDVILAYTYCCPLRLQGEQAPASIVAAIERVELDGRAEVLSRGGGAVEELACFDERVVRAVANCSISDYWHRSSARRVLDLVADACAHTPPRLLSSCS